MTYHQRLEWDEWAMQAWERRQGRPPATLTGLRTSALTGRGRGEQEIVVTFTVDQVLEMLRADPAACERLLFHADLVRGSRAISQLAGEIAAKEVKAS